MEHLIGYLIIVCCTLLGIVFGGGFYGALLGMLLEPKDDTWTCLKRLGASLAAMALLVCSIIGLAALLPPK